MTENENIGGTSLNDERIMQHVDRILDKVSSDLGEASDRIRNKVKFQLPYLADLYAGAEAIAVAEIGTKYCVVDSGDFFKVERRMNIRTSSAGDLNGANYEVFKLAEIERNNYSLSFLEKLARLNDLRASE